jgi:hypothetical protein
MNTLLQFSRSNISMPPSTGWYLADLGEGIGKQRLFMKQAPRRLKVLREHAVIESAVSSNRIEGVEVDQKRIGTVLFGKPALRDRDEEEVRGYREALDLIHSDGAMFPSMKPRTGGCTNSRGAKYGTLATTSKKMETSSSATPMADSACGSGPCRLKDPGCDEATGPPVARGIKGTVGASAGGNSRVQP